MPKCIDNTTNVYLNVHFCVKKKKVGHAKGGIIIISSSTFSYKVRHAGSGMVINTNNPCTFSLKVDMWEVR